MGWRAWVGWRACLLASVGAAWYLGKRLRPPPQQLLDWSRGCAATGSSTAAAVSTAAIAVKVACFTEGGGGGELGLYHRNGGVIVVTGAEGKGDKARENPRFIYGVSVTRVARPGPV